MSSPDFFRSWYLQKVDPDGQIIEVDPIISEATERFIEIMLFNVLQDTDINLLESIKQLESKIGYSIHFR